MAASQAILKDLLFLLTLQWPFLCSALPGGSQYEPIIKDAKQAQLYELVSTLLCRVWCAAELGENTQ
jgi:hypothetical protein